jgi:hypothetical protein
MNRVLRTVIAGISGITVAILSGCSSHTTSGVSCQSATGSERLRCTADNIAGQATTPRIAEPEKMPPKPVEPKLLRPQKPEPFLKDGEHK